MASGFGSITSGAFNGSSKFSSDFQQVLTRAVSIASLPAKQMQNDQLKLTSQQSALQSLQSTFSSLQTALENIGSAAKGRLVAAVSDPTLVRATASADALDGTYTMEVTGLGSSTNTLSKSTLTTVSDPNTTNISGSSAYTLTINGTGHSISPAGNSLQTLASAINDAALGVQATIVNVGSNSSPDYRLAVTGNKLAGDTIQLNDGSADLLDTLSTGAAATYKVGGLASEIQSDSRTVTLAPGLTVDLLKASIGQNVSITVSHDFTTLENSLSNLVSSYNAATAAVAGQRGKDAGPLSGQSIVFSMSQALRSLTQYSTSDPAGSLTALGLSLDQNGQLSFDSVAFNAIGTHDVQTFLGGIDSAGFLKSAHDAVATIADGTSGAIEGSITALDTQIARSKDLIAREEDRITALQANMEQRLAAADAAIAVLQSQVTYMTNLFSTMYPNSNSNKNSV